MYIYIYSRVSPEGCAPHGARLIEFHAQGVWQPWRRKGMATGARKRYGNLPGGPCAKTSKIGMPTPRGTPGGVHGSVAQTHPPTFPEDF